MDNIPKLRKATMLCVYMCIIIQISTVVLPRDWIDAFYLVLIRYINLLPSTVVVCV